MNRDSGDKSPQEKRQSERVQFFQLGKDQDIQPIWVFRQTYPKSILGLVLDVTADGAQILTNKTQELAEERCRLIIHSDEEVLQVNVRHRWSRPDGTLYVRHGFVCDEPTSLQSLLPRLGGDTHWLRCEILPLGDGRETSG